MNPNQNHTEFDIQGHRGARGLLPENTLPSFKKALELGVTTLELDLCVSRDSKIVVSHEPYFSHTISTPPEGTDFNASNEKEFNLFKMTYEEIQQWDVGLKPLQGFQNQHKIAVTKPLLSDVFSMAETYVSDHERNTPLFYNIEIKSQPEGDGIYHPEVEVFADLVMNVIDSFDIHDRVIIQSFDIRPLQYLHSTYPDMVLALLIQNVDSPEVNIERLGFTPEIYSPYYLLVDDYLLGYCKENNMRLIPWTVNDANTMRSLIIKGVDGIITDYPDILIDVYQDLKENAGNKKSEL